MKKNLRIVSAAAAALLAVAPVAAAAVSPASAEITTNNAFTSFDKINNGTVVTHGLNLSGTVGKVSEDDVKTAINAAVNRKFGNGFSAENVEGISNVKNFAAGTYKVTFNIKTTASSLTTDQAKELGGTTSVVPTVGTGADAGFVVAGTPAKKVSYTVDLKLANAAQPAKPADTALDKINAGSSNIYDADANTAVNISAVAKDGNIPSAVNGNIVATLDGKQVTALLHGDTNTRIYEVVGKGGVQVMQPVSASELKSNKLYYAHFNHVTMSLGNAYSGKPVTFTLPNGSSFAGNVAGAKYSNYYKSVDGTEVPRTITVTADANGVVDLGTVVSRFYAYDAKNLQEVHFYSQKTGNEVTSGSLDLHAVNGKLSVQSLFAAMSHEYVASQLVKGTHSTNKIDTLAPQNDLRDQLKKQNITVDDYGYFTAPASFTVNMTAVSKINGAKASLPVTINVDNAAASNNTNEQTKNVTIVHIAAVYTKNGVKTTERLRAYDSVSVVATPVTLKDANGKEIAGKFYKLAGQDKYIKVSNIDGTSKTLKHNSYVYTQYGKKAYKKNGKAVKLTKKVKRSTLRKEASGKTLTVYGGALFNKQYYRIGKNQYIKVANFR